MVAAVVLQRGSDMKQHPQPVSVNLSDMSWARGALGLIAGVHSKCLSVTVCMSLGTVGQAVRLAHCKPERQLCNDLLNHVRVSFSVI